MMQRVTMADIARAVGVSKNAVSLALRNDPQISESTRKRVREAAERLGYRRNAAAGEIMARMRSKQVAAKASLALLNANTDREAFTKHPTIPTYLVGCRRRAEHLGYALDTFWLHDPELKAERLDGILRSRGIRGALVVGLMKENRLPERFERIWNQYPCVVTGVRTRQPALSFACTDHHIVALRAFEKALELGYRRPGLVLDAVIDRLVEGRFTAGYRSGQEALPKSRRLHPFTAVEAARKDRDRFRRWFEKSRPDVLFTLYNEVRDWLRELGLSVPRDIGLIQLEWRKDRPEWAGMNQHNEETGEAAVDMLVSMIHGGEAGPPPFPRATLVGGSWVDGATVQRRLPQR